MNEARMEENLELAEALDAYLDGLRAGRPGNREAILKRFPQAGPLLDCLDGLNQLADLSAPIGLAEAGDWPTVLTEEEVTFDWEDEGATAQPLGAERRGVGVAEDPNPRMSQFGRYELLGLLGQGGMGVVYKARQRDLGRCVAIKMIAASQLVGPEQVKRFDAEARALASIRHPHILQVYEAGECAGQRYFAMEYVEGGSLAERIKKGLPTPEDAARCMGAIASAVAYLHERGIVHRDLKPANILLDGEGRPYVTDFGLVKMVGGSSQLTSTGAIVGTPSYMAPEQAAGRNEQVGPLSDVYSLGAILYELLTGQPPFREATPLDTLVQVLEGEPALPRQVNAKVPADLETICVRAMAKAPEKRYPSAQALVEDLDRFLRGEAVLTPAQSFQQRLLRWGRQEPGLVCRLVIILICAVIAQAYYMAQHPVSFGVHSVIMAILGAWALVSAGCQALLRANFRPEPVRRLWLAADTSLLTAVLVMDESYGNALVLTYAALIVASGLWFRVSLVWFTTAIVMIAYGALLMIGWYWGGLQEGMHHYLIVAVAMLMVAAMVATQVKRVRALSRYYEHRPLP